MADELTPLDVPDLPAVLDECIRLALELRQRATLHELVFMKYLMMLEDREDLWHAQADSSGTFVSFLQRFHICDAGRYTVGRKAVERFEAERLRVLGMDNARIVMRRMPTPELQEEAALRLEASAEKNGVAPSARETARICDNISREKGHLKSRPVVSRLDALEEELRAAKQRIADLEAENARLRERLGDDDPSGGARSASKKPNGRRKQGNPATEAGA